MEPRGIITSSWSNPQAYGFAIFCLLIGLVMGYFIHGPSQLDAGLLPPRKTNRSASEQRPVSLERLRHMADKRVEPLLAKLEQNPGDPGLLAEVGKAYFYAHQFRTATEYFERSVKIKPDVRILTTLGGAYHLDGDDTKAIVSWNRALELDPNYADALFNLGLVRWQAQSDATAAIAAWERLLKTNPNHPERAQVEQLIARAKQHMKGPTEKHAKPVM